MKLNPAIEKLKRMCGEKGPNDPEEFDIMNLVLIIDYHNYTYDYIKFIINRWQELLLAQFLEL